jgi:hypothetical protein
MKESVSRMLPGRAGRLCAVLAACLILAAGVAEQASAQPKFQLKRTKRETQPVTVRLYGGYNGMSEIAEPFQDRFENTFETEWGGLLMGIQGSVLIDTIGRPFWLGADVSSFRLAKRRLSVRRDVFYKNDSSAVDAIEQVSGLGIHAVLSIDVVRRIGLQLGVGVQYMTGSANVLSEVVGLFESRWIPSVYIGITFTALKYEHGSIDFDFRGMKGIDGYGSFQFQSALVFTFNF